jgi:hypothetical protein
VSTAALTVGTHLWMHWLQIISERERAAIAARAQVLELGARGERVSDALSEEMQASMVAISGAAHAIDALYGEIKPLVPVPAATLAAWRANRTGRHDRIFETLKLGCTLGDRSQRWPKQFHALYLLRGPAVHHGVKHRPAAPHPSGIAHVSQENADYSVENVRESVDLAFDVILTAMRQPKEPKLVAWAEEMAHVPAAVEAWRSP